MEGLNLDLQTTLPALTFDFAGLKAWALGITEKYANLVVREEDVTAIKSEMAGLNKAKKAVDDARKEAVRRVSEPIKAFEAQVKEVTGLFATTYDALAGQVKEFEDREREAKRVQVKVLIDSLLDEHKLNGFPIPIQDSWLNKSKPMKTVKAEVESLILAHKKELEDKAALEQARRDRAASIEEKCAELSAQHGFTLTASVFLDLLDDMQRPQAEVMEAIEQGFSAAAAKAQREAAAKAAQAAPATPSPTPASAPPAQAPATPQPPRPPMFRPAGQAPARKSLTLDLEYDPAQEAVILTLVRNLESLCITLTRVTGQSRAAA